MNPAGTPFIARNPVEEQLLAAQEGRLDAETFLRGLLDEQVFMPVRDEGGIGGFQTSTRGIPLTLDTDDGRHVLVLFTSPERARDYLADFPGFEGGLLAELRWILDKVGSGYGITLNPGCEVGLDLEAEEIAALM